MAVDGQNTRDEAACLVASDFAATSEDNCALKDVGAILVVVGCIWFLQGIDVFPGSFMSGQVRWTVYGGIAAAIGIAVLLHAAQKRHPDR